MNEPLAHDPAESPDFFVAVCGKGGVGKTALSALLARALLSQGVRPLLLVDADPVGGLDVATGLSAERTIGSVRDAIVRTARAGSREEKEAVVDQVDFLVQEALVEGDDASLLSMGYKRERGCFCPVNSLLRDGIDLLASAFSGVIIDAEAGIEQVNRQVTRRVRWTLAVTDASSRSIRAAERIAEVAGRERILVVQNRYNADAPGIELPRSLEVIGNVPEDPALARLDRMGRPLWELPETSPASLAIASLARILVGLGRGHSPVPL